MAEDTAHEQDAQEEAPTSSDATKPPESGWKARFGRMGQSLAKHWFVGLVTVALVGHAAGLWVFAIQRTTPAVVESSEIDLGRYEFRNTSAPGGKVSGVEFALHIRFIDEVESRARRQLADRRFRVEQDIEEILRQAHAADFADPHLRELKRQLQEQINRSLELRSVADVIVTDLDVQPASDTAGAARQQPQNGSPETDAGAQVADESDWADTPSAS